MGMGVKKILNSFWENVIAKTLTLLFFALGALLYSILKWEQLRNWLKIEIPVWSVIAVSVLSIITFFIISKMSFRKTKISKNEKKQKKIESELEEFTEYTHETNKNVKFVFRLYCTPDTLEPFIGNSAYKLWCTIHKPPILMYSDDSLPQHYYSCPETNCKNNWDFNAISREKINSYILSLAEEKIRHLR